MTNTELELVVKDESTNQRERAEKDRLFKRYEIIGKSLGSARRLEIIDLLINGERTVEDVAESTAMSVANASQHLRNLLNAGLLTVRREGSYAFYRLALESDIATLWNSMRSLAHTVDPGLRFERLTLAGISCEQLHQKLDESSFVVIDVRSAHDFNGGRIRSAVSIPLESLEMRIGELATDQEYCVYDRGAASTLAGIARTMLTQAGCNVRLLDGGYARWKSEGRPTTRSIASN